MNSQSLFDSQSETQPRERMLEFGASTLSDSELISIIMRSGSSKKNVHDLSRFLIKEFGGLRYLLEADVHTLMKCTGVGIAKACSIKASYELGVRLRMRPDEKVKITSPEDIYKLIKHKIFRLKKEHLYVVSLDSRLNVISTDLLTMGTVNETLIHPREVFSVALLKSAISICVVHNHPSGDPTPSDQDIQVTKRLFDSGVVLGVRLLDHLIACDSSYTSLKEKGYIRRFSFEEKGGEKFEEADLFV